MGMTRSKGLILAAVLFLTGALVGVLAGEAWHLLRGGPFGRMERLGPKAFILERMGEDLVLTADQKAKLKPLIEEMVDKLDQVHKPCFEEDQVIFERYQAQIRSLLTPEQAAKHKAMMERFSRRNGPGMPPPPPPGHPGDGPRGMPPPPPPGSPPPPPPAPPGG